MCEPEHLNRAVPLRFPAMQTADGAGMRRSAVNDSAEVFIPYLHAVWLSPVHDSQGTV